MLTSNTKKNIGITALAAIIVAGVGIASSAYISQAKSGNNNGANGLKGMMQRFGKPLTHGTVTAINGTSITLSGGNGTTYTVNAANAKVYLVANNSKTNGQVADIKVGDTLSVAGTVSGTTITATNIVDGQIPARQQPAAAGTVSNLNGDTFNITGNGTAYTVNAGNVQVDIFKSGTSLQNSGVQNGDMVSVFGTVSGNTITATKILDGAGKGFGRGGMGMMNR